VFRASTPAPQEGPETPGSLEGSGRGNFEQEPCQGAVAHKPALPGPPRASPRLNWLRALVHPGADAPTPISRRPRAAWGGRAGAGPRRAPARRRRSA
jgi:hypothetical protein